MGQELEAVKLELNGFKKQQGECNTEIHKKLDKMLLAIGGDDELKIVGIAQRVTKLEKQQASIMLKLATVAGAIGAISGLVTSMLKSLFSSKQ